MAKIVLAITGSIAAPKGIELYYELIKDHDVELIVTHSAQKFIKKIPASAKTDIFMRDFYDKTDLSEHIEIARNAELFICYPASQQFIAQVAMGLVDNLASIVYSASNCHKMIFPAMNTQMYNSKANLRNMKLLEQDGIEVLPAKIGMLACNTVGIGRAWEWIDIVKYVNDFFAWKDKFKSKKIMLNFGRTRTYLDGIRYITNNSSGKMGDALHTVLGWSGAELTTIIGDVDEPINYEVIKIKTNQEMLTTMAATYDQQDIVICCAALNDYQGKNISNTKISKKDYPTLTLELEPNIDVLATLGAKKTKQLLVGFSAQNDLNLDYARSKLLKKNLDLIVINEIKAMESDQNSVILLTKNNDKKINLTSKLEVAKGIMNVIIELLEKRG